MKEMGLTKEEYRQYQREQRFKKYERKRQKDRIRFKTIRYIERYCNLEMKCQICEDKAEIHHPNYNDYLKINFLCKKHHTQLHNFELIPPPIIDLQKNTIKIPTKEEKQKYITEQIENIKNDILNENFTYNKLHEKYNLAPSTIRTHLEKEENWNVLKAKLKVASRFSKLRNKENLVQKYRIEKGLSLLEFSNITKIPISTIRAIECGKTSLSKIKPKTKEKLKLVLDK